MVFLPTLAYLLFALPEPLQLHESFKGWLTTVGAAFADGCGMFGLIFLVQKYK